METGITNIIVLLLLTVALAGDTFFPEVESMWGRWLPQCGSLLCAPGRIFWLGGVLLKSAFKDGLGWAGRLIGGCLLIIPAGVLALVFGSLLASGNPIFGSWTNSFFSWFWDELALYFDPWRITLWFFIGLLILPLLRPAPISTGRWSWTPRLPNLPAILPTAAAIFSSGAVLVVLNLIFLVANSADAFFLWSSRTLPSGMTYSGFVHDGVNSLITTVILSAAVLTLIFQQESGVATRRALKILATIWIAQNLFLLLSVGLRLKLYIEAYDMTVERLGVLIFLVLVAIGYGLLTIKIARDKSLPWLLSGSTLALFFVLYVTQFLNLAGWSADYNVAQWEKDRSRKLDLGYLYELGPGAWPALRKATDEGAVSTCWYEDRNDNQTQNPMAAARNGEAVTPRAQFTRNAWREFSLRAYLNHWALEEKPK